MARTKETNKHRRIEYVDGKAYDLSIPVGKPGSQWGPYNAARRKGHHGRPKGSKNVVTVDMQQAVRSAFQQAGGDKYLLKLSETHPELFVRLLVRLMPTTIDAEVKHSIGDIVERIGHGRQRLQALEALPAARSDSIRRIEQDIVAEAERVETERIEDEETDQ